MFENIPYNKKVIGLIIITIMLSIAAYKRSFSLTLSAYNQMNDLHDRLAYIHASNEDYSTIDQEIRVLDDLIGKKGIDPERVQQELLNFVSINHNNKVSIVDVAKIHESTNKDFLIYTNQLTLKGNYQDLLEVIASFETDFDYSRLVSIAFEKKKNYKNKINILNANLIFQNYEKK